MKTKRKGKKITQKLVCYSTERQAVDEIFSEFSLEQGHAYVAISEEELLKYEQPQQEIRKYKVTLTVEQVSL